MNNNDIYKFHNDLNQTYVKYDQTQCVHHLFEKQAALNPLSTAVYFQHDKITYSTLNKRANQLANYLEKQGVRPGALIAISVERSIHMIIGILGIMKAGATYIPIDPNYPQSRISYILHDSKPSLILTQKTLKQKLAIYKGKLITIDELNNEPKHINTNKSRIHDGFKKLIYTIYTSGSTGKPKGVQIYHKSVVNLLQDMKRKISFYKNDSFLAITSLSFDISFVEIFLPLITGGSLVLADEKTVRDGYSLSNLINESNITHLQAVPSTWQMLIEAGWKGNKNLTALCGGDIITKSLVKKLYPLVKSLWNWYGPTETTIWSTAYKFTSEQDSISIGKPISNTQTYILDTELNPVPVGVAGELYIGGDGLAKGYLNKQELTEERFIKNPFINDSRLYKTGDLAKYRSDGNIELLGRMDHQVKVRGYRIELGEIENTLDQNAQISKAIVVVQITKSNHKKIVAYVTPASHSINIKEIRKYLESKLPSYMIPSNIIKLDTLPLTPNGKIDRSSLAKSTYHIEKKHGYIPPRNQIEKQLCNIWSEFLEVESVSINDNFFDLGGNSLLSVQIVSKINKEFGNKPIISNILEFQTIEDLAKIIDQFNETSKTNHLVKIKTTGSMPPFYLVNTSSGTLESYVDFIKRVNANRPIYGFQTVQLNESSHTIKELARIYTNTLISITAREPIFLLGFSIGGNIAIEMAQQLSKMGKKNVLFLIDTVNGSTQWDLRLLDDIYYWCYKFKSIFDSDILSRKLSSLNPEDHVKYIVDQLKIMNKMPPRFLYKTFEETCTLLSNQKFFIQATIQHTPMPYNGDVYLIRAIDQKHSGSTDKLLGWGNLFTGNFKVTHVTGTHFTMMRHPNVEQIVRFVEEISHKY